jgi:hypothetical protein
MQDDNNQKPGAEQGNPPGSGPKNDTPPKDPVNGHKLSPGELDGLTGIELPGASIERDWPPPPGAPPFPDIDDDPDRDPGGEIDDDAEIARLARLKPLVFERVAKAAAKRLGCPVGMLRRLVALARGEGQNGQGAPLELPEIEAWPEPVDGDSLLKAVTAAIQRHVVIGLAAARVVALWTVAMHCFSVFALFPRLFVTAAEMQCGKTTLLEVLSLLVPRSLAVSNTTPAALFRAIAAVRPTMLLDEFDGYAKETVEELRQIINAGHKRGGAVLRVVGDNHEPRLFDVYAPMAIASIDAIAATLMDRSIIIRLQRRLASEAITPLRLDRAPDMQTLARQIARWATDHAAELADADPVMGGLINRPADNWRPLFAVADLAGNGWHDLADEAAATVAAAATPIEKESARTLLLTDIRAAFAAKATDQLTSEAIVGYLVSLEDRPWPEWGKTRKPISKTQVARLLAPLSISPGTVHPPGENHAKGYKKTAFRNAFARYLPPQ